VAKQILMSYDCASATLRAVSRPRMKGRTCLQILTPTINAGSAHDK
jgi:hypothetical protein